MSQISDISGLRGSSQFGVDLSKENPCSFAKCPQLPTRFCDGFGQSLVESLRIVGSSLPVMVRHNYRHNHRRARCFLRLIRKFCLRQNGLPLCSGLSAPAVALKLRYGTSGEDAPAAHHWWRPFRPDCNVE